MIELNKTYKFTVTETTLNSKGEPMFKLKGPDPLDEKPYYAFPLKCQPLEHLPQYIYCTVKKIEDTGVVKLQQEEYELFQSLYEENKPYLFVIKRQILDSKAGKRRYIIESPFGLEHIFTAHNFEEFSIGDEVRMGVHIRKTEYHTTSISFFVYQELGQFEPKKVFESCGHAEEYTKYFVELKEWIAHTDKILHVLKKMENKLQSNNRLWIFDYTSALLYVAVSSDEELLDEVEICNILVRDIESWLLNESGILSKFSPEKREETIQKSEQLISRAEATIEAISLIKKGKQSTYLTSMLQKLRKSMYLRNRDHVFSVLYRLVTLKSSFLKNNIAELSELIDFTSREVNDAYILERIVTILSYHINGEKKLINQDLHFKRNTEDADKKILANLVIGIGTLLNFHALKELGKRNDYGIIARQLFPTLCKYLSYMTTKDKALLLINKSLLAVLSKSDYFKLDGRLLRNVLENPEALIDYILHLQFHDINRSVASCRNHVYEKYMASILSVAFNSSNLTLKGIDTHLYNVYTIPGTILNIASFIEQSPWENSDSILFYKDKWKELLSQGYHVDTDNDQTATVSIRTKQINHNYTNFIFCTRDDNVINEDGVIGYKNYTNNFSAPNLNEVFQENQQFEAEVIRHENGNVNFDITKNIREFSIELAEDLDESTLGLCLGYNSIKKEAFFITPEGINCTTYVDGTYYVGKGRVFELMIDLSQNEDDYPIADIINESDEVLDKILLLRNQLTLLSEYNKSHCYIEETSKSGGMPYIVLILDNYLRLFDDKVIKYNLYQLFRLVALAEKSTLSNYYTSYIQYLEMTESFVENAPIDYSVPDFEWDEKVQSQFPSLRKNTEIYDLLNNFGSENDLEYLFRLSLNNTEHDQANKLARLSLAASLIESVSDDEQAIGHLRGLVAEELGGTADKKIISIDVTSDLEESEAKKTVTNFGLEGQTKEFKTSVVYVAGNHTADLEHQMDVILKVMAGFLNAKGGTLYIGVKDDGTPSGIAPDLESLDCNIDKYERIIRNRIVREFNKDVNGTIGITFIESGDKQICEITIPPYIAPIGFRDEFYQRQGNETRILKGSDLVMFIRRRVEGKSTIIHEDPIVKQTNVSQENHTEKVDNVVAHSTMENAISGVQDKDFNVYLIFFADGTYKLSESRLDTDSIAQVRINKSMLNSFVLQCYDNGCVNKIPVRNLYNLQLDYQYKNGLHPEAVLKKVMVTTNSDYIVVTSTQHKNQYIKVIPVSDISAHTTLGLRGNQLLSQNFDSVDEWYMLLASDAPNVSKFITKTRTNLGWNMSSLAHRQEICWFNKNVYHQDVQNIVKVQVKSPKEKLQSDLDARNYDDLYTYFESLIQRGSTVPKARSMAQELLGNSKTTEEFWFLALLLLNCNLSVFRKPVIDIIQTFDDPMDFAPSSKLLDQLVQQVFTFDHKYHQSIGLVYPFRTILSREAKAYIFKTVRDLSSPEDYAHLFEMTNIGLSSAVDFLVEENTMAAMYELFIILEESYKQNRFDNDMTFIANTLTKIQPSSTQNRMIIDFITLFLLEQKPKFGKSQELLLIKKGGFDEYRETCLAVANKLHHDSVLDEIEGCQGKKLQGRVIQNYQNHYLISCKDGINVLLQHDWASKKHDVEDTVSVKIRSINKSNKTLFGAEQEDFDQLPQKLPLLNIGTELEVKFSKYKNQLIPEVKGAYSKVRVNVIDFPEKFDFRKRYKASVCRMVNQFEFDVRLIEVVL